MQGMGCRDKISELLSPECNGIRIRLRFEEGIDRENAWFFVDFNKIGCIRRLRKKICDRFDLKREEINLYLDDFLLTPDETISILQENDCVSVRLKAKEEDEETKSKTNDANNQNKSFKSKKRRKEDDYDNHRKKPLDKSGSSEPCKKKRRQLPSKTQKKLAAAIPVKETKTEPKSGNAEGTTGGKSHKPNKHIRFNDDDSKECDEDSKVEDEVTQNVTQEVHENGRKKSYEDFPPLRGPPRVGDILAFKELVLSESYTPEVSEFQEGKVIGMNGNSVTLCIKNRSSLPQRANGKFELNWEEMDDEEPQMEVSEELTLSLDSLLHPKLMTVGY